MILFLLFVFSNAALIKEIIAIIPAINAKNIDMIFKPGIQHLTTPIIEIISATIPSVLLPPFLISVPGAGHLLGAKWGDGIHYIVVCERKPLAGCIGFAKNVVMPVFFSAPAQFSALPVTVAKRGLILQCVF